MVHPSTIQIINDLILGNGKFSGLYKTLFELRGFQGFHESGHKITAQQICIISTICTIYISSKIN